MLCICTCSHVLQIYFHPVATSCPDGRRRHNKLRLTINVLVIVGCTLGLAFQASQCIRRYWKAETKIVLKIKPTGEATYLALTICPSYDDAYKVSLTPRRWSCQLHLIITLSTDTCFELNRHSPREILPRGLLRQCIIQRRSVAAL